MAIQPLGIKPGKQPITETRCSMHWVCGIALGRFLSIGQRIGNNDGRNSFFAADLDQRSRVIFHIVFRKNEQRRSARFNNPARFKDLSSVIQVGQDETKKKNPIGETTCIDPPIDLSHTLLKTVKQGSTGYCRGFRGRKGGEIEKGKPFCSADLQILLNNAIAILKKEAGFKCGMVFEQASDANHIAKMRIDEHPEQNALLLRRCREVRSSGTVRASKKEGRTQADLYPEEISTREDYHLRGKRSQGSQAPPSPAHELTGQIGNGRAKPSSGPACVFCSFRNRRRSVRFRPFLGHPRHHFLDAAPAQPEDFQGKTPENTL